jgi:hypothetical protein
MRCARAYTTYEEFEREELNVNRGSAWSIDELEDDFVIVDDMDLDLLEGDDEPEEVVDDDE